MCPRLWAAESGRDRLRGLLRVGVHHDVGVTEPAAAPDARVTQVYCSALPVAYSRIPAAEWTQFATLILEAAYEATVLAAVLNAGLNAVVNAVLNAAGGGSRRLFLTRIGDGAFGNDDAWINAAMLRALHCAADQGIEVLMVSHGPPNATIRAVEAAWRNKGVAMGRLPLLPSCQQGKNDNASNKAYRRSGYGGTKPWPKCNETPKLRCVKG